MYIKRVYEKEYVVVSIPPLVRRINEAPTTPSGKYEIDQSICTLNLQIFNFICNKLKHAIFTEVCY